MSQRSIPKLSPLPSAPLTSGRSYPPFEKPAVTVNNYAKDVRDSESPPWYRRTKLLVVIIVAALVVVGIAVGAAVGVTQSNKNKSQSSGTLKSSEENQLPTSTTTLNAGGTRGVPVPTGGTRGTTAAGAQTR